MSERGWSQIGRLDGTVSNVDMTLGLEFVVEVKTDAGSLRIKTRDVPPEEGDEVRITLKARKQ